MWLLGINQKWTRTNWNSVGPRTCFLESNDEHNARLILVLFTNLDLLMVFSNNNAFGKPKNQVLRRVLTYCMRTRPRSQLSDPRVTFSFSFPFFPSRAFPLSFTRIHPFSCCRLLLLQTSMENEISVTYQTKVSMCRRVCMENRVVSNQWERSAWRASAIRYDFLRATCAFSTN